MKLSFVNKNSIFLTKQRKINRWVQIIGLSTFLSVFSVNKVLNAYPSQGYTTHLLNSSYDECKTKVNRATNLIFSEVQTVGEKNGYFQLFGITPNTVATLICVESERGTYFVFSLSSGPLDMRKSEQKSLYDRVVQYMQVN